ncbi:MAG: hypothetical protein KTR16_08075 [Acidiferrobacterales bacterium]|nr:hypothetical protein [Acidiferrobacterales bacterium]
MNSDNSPERKDSPELEKSPEQIRKTQFWNRIQLLLVMAVFIAPIAAAFFYKPSSFIKYGDIYTPVRAVDNLVMTGDAGAIELDSLRRQWIFLVTAKGQCGSACEENLLKIRQLRFMQNNDMTRIRTVFLHNGLATEKAIDLAAKYSPIESYSATTEAYDEWTKVLTLDEATKVKYKEQNIDTDFESDRFYIIDPAGNLMMSYPADADPNFIKVDIKRLLKASQIG